MKNFYKNLLTTVMILWFGSANVKETNLSNYESNILYRQQNTQRTISSVVKSSIISLEQILLDRRENNELSSIFIQKEDIQKKAISIDLGNTEDQKFFVNWLARKKCFKVYSATHVRLELNINVNYVGDNETIDSKIIRVIHEKQKQLYPLLTNSSLVHLSGNHFPNDVLIFGGSIQNTRNGNEYFLESAIDLSDFPVCDNARIVFITACYGVRANNKFTSLLVNIFPNAVILGYGGRSAPGQVNAQILEKFFLSIGNNNLFHYSKEDIGRLWIKTGRQIYEQRGEKFRDLRAIYKNDNYTVIELYYSKNSINIFSYLYH
ncbi:MAG: hypothetical protein QXG00_04740 [Candidatus Woesearchaeota archaeon]